MIIAATAVAVTIGALLLGLNLKGGEKSIEQSIARLYDVQDRLFDRAMGVLRGPAIVAGNRVDVLLNGDEIFPSMLAAIRGAQTSITFASYIYWWSTATVFPTAASTSLLHSTKPTFDPSLRITALWSTFCPRSRPYSRYLPPMASQPCTDWRLNSR
jgi:hypothetical protein